VKTKNPEQFFALSQGGSLFCAHLNKRHPHSPNPVLEKIGQLPMVLESRWEVGKAVGNWPMISIGKELLLFLPEGGGGTSYQRDAYMCNTRWHGPQTSPIAALALTRERIDAIAEEWRIDPGPEITCLDPRWKADTIEVLRAIGDDHPHCSIADSYLPKRMMERSEWIIPEQELAEQGAQSEEKLTVNSPEQPTEGEPAF
jgi:hypothetical protein